MHIVYCPGVHVLVVFVSFWSDSLSIHTSDPVPVPQHCTLTSPLPPLRTEVRSFLESRQQGPPSLRDDSPAEGTGDVLPTAPVQRCTDSLEVGRGQSRYGIVGEIGGPNLFSEVILVHILEVSPASSGIVC